MSTFKESILQSFRSAMKTIETYPIVIASALAFAVVTMIRIQLDWPLQEDYNFLFNCLHLAFATSAVFGLMAITFVQSRYNHFKKFLAANLMGIVVAIIMFLMLFLFGGVDSSANTYTATYISSIAASRVTVAIIVCLIGFIYFGGYSKEQTHFAKSLFMFQKSAFIALIYGFVLMSGTSGVAGAVQALLYRNMSEKVYMYLATITGFVAFTIFVGYFPDFRKGKSFEHRSVAQKQPRFIEILFEYIMIPISLALTVVLLIWTAKTVITGTWPSYSSISGIVISYILGGIWLHFMVTHYISDLSKFYRKVYPISAIFILFFGLWALVRQLNDFGLMMQEYYFTLICITALAVVILLLLRKENAHGIIALLVCSTLIVSSLPLVGSHTLPVRMQLNRLEDILIEEGILVDNELIATSTELEKKTREVITESVDFLSYAENAKLPKWFDEDLNESYVFKSKFGFDQTWFDRDYLIREDGMSTSLFRPNEVLDISPYDWFVSLQYNYRYSNEETKATIKGANGIYTIILSVNERTRIPTLIVLLDEEVILDYTMKKFLDDTATKFRQNLNISSEATVEDMTFRFETTELSLMIVFNSIEIEVDPRDDTIDYFIDMNGLYLKEK